jgi:hypothetical protein
MLTASIKVPVGSEAIKLFKYESHISSFSRMRNPYFIIMYCKKLRSRDKTRRMYRVANISVSVVSTNLLDAPATSRILRESMTTLGL